MFVLPVSVFPIPPEEKDPAAKFLGELSARIQSRTGLKREVLIQMTQLRFPTGSSQLFSRYGREWIPAMGLGVWPYREPPTIWTARDFEELVPGQAPRTLIDQVFRITKSEEAKVHARDIMFGYGTVAEVLTVETTDQFLDSCRKVLLPPITDPTYTCFPFYVPLLDAKSVANARESDIDQWTCGVSLYLRESTEDNGVLIATRIPLIHELEELGARQIQEQTGEWVVDINASKRK